MVAYFLLLFCLFLFVCLLNCPIRFFLLAKLYYQYLEKKFFYLVCCDFYTKYTYMLSCVILHITVLLCVMCTIIS